MRVVVTIFFRGGDQRIAAQHVLFWRVLDSETYRERAQL